MTRIIKSLADVSDRYDALFVDLWGCLHNGVAPFPDAVAALAAYRRAGGTVVLITNAPRHRDKVELQLDRMGVPRDSWDEIVSSGDTARIAAAQGAVGRRVWFMGEKHDLSFFDPLDGGIPLDLERVDLDAAEGIVCCGPFDPYAPVEDLRPQLLFAKQKRLTLLCANPDIVVDRGDRREWCAGAVARLYSDIGGESVYVGKPHPPIYDLARNRLAAHGRAVPDSRILAIGDGIGTDIAGAMGEDIDSMFVTGGIAADETGTVNGQPDPGATKAYLARHGLSPTLVIGTLR